MKTASTALVRRFALPVAALLGVSALGVAPATASRRAVQLDPCSAVSAGAVNAAFGASSDTPEYGTPGSQKSHGATAKNCSWTYAAARLVVSVAPKTFKPPAWPSGTSLRKASGLGVGAKLATNTRPGTTFIAVTFTKGAHWGEVWVSGGTGSASVLKLARLLYAKL
jgi:hypothetical protein